MLRLVEYIYIALLPLNLSLSGIAGRISLINYIFLLYFILSIIYSSKIINIRFIKVQPEVSIYFLYALISVLWNHYLLDVSWAGFTFVSSYLIYILFVTKKRETGYIEIINNILFTSALFISIIFIINLTKGEDLFNRYSLSFGNEIDPNYFVSQLIPINYVLVRNIFEKKFLIPSIMAYFIILFIELFSGSRGGVIANVSILVVYIMFKTNSKKIIRTFLIKVVIIFIFILSIILMIRYIPNWIIVRFMPGNIIDSNGSGRIHIWTKAIEFFVSQSFLAIMFGNGGFSFPRIAETFLGYRKYAHNVFIQSLIEGGVIGFLIVLYLYSIILVKAIKHKNIDQLALIVAAIIASMTLDFNLTRAFWFLFMLIFYQEAKPGNYFPALS